MWRGFRLQGAICRGLTPNTVVQNVLAVLRCAQELTQPSVVVEIVVRRTQRDRRVHFQQCLPVGVSFLNTPDFHRPQSRLLGNKCGEEFFLGYEVGP